jgi:hypothetical protein
MNLAYITKMIMMILIKIFAYYHCRKMTREFEELVLYGHNYPTWVIDVKIRLALRGMYEAIVPLLRGLYNCWNHTITMSYILQGIIFILT